MKMAKEEPPLGEKKPVYPFQSGTFPLGWPVYFFYALEEEVEGLFLSRVRVIFVPWRWKWWKWKWRDFWCLGFEGWLVIDFYF
jgi:hypothetical protein